MGRSRISGFPPPLSHMRQFSQASCMHTRFLGLPLPGKKKASHAIISRRKCRCSFFGPADGAVSRILPSGHGPPPDLPSQQKAHCAKSISPSRASPPSFLLLHKFHHTFETYFFSPSISCHRTSRPFVLFASEFFSSSNRNSQAPFIFMLLFLSDQLRN